MAYASPEFQNRMYTRAQVERAVEESQRWAIEGAVLEERKRCQWIIKNYGFNTSQTHALMEGGQSAGEIAAAAMAGTGAIPANIKTLAAKTAAVIPGDFAAGDVIQRM